MAYNLTQANGAAVQALLDQVENLKTFNIADAGAIEGGSNDCTSALQTIINSEGHNVCITIPQGDWLFEGHPYFNYAGVYIRGAAARATRILFEPSQAGACFEWNKSQSLEQSPGGCFDMSFYSSDATYAKTAIKFTDGSNFNIRDVIIGGTHPTNAPYHWADISESSIGIDGFGREVTAINDIRIFADNPVVFGPNPNHTFLDVDQFHLSNTYLVAPIGSANSLVTIRDDTEMYSFTIDGYNAWARGRCGLYLNSPTNSNNVVSHTVKLSNIRCEQGDSASGETYCIYISHDIQEIQMLTLSNLYGDTGRKNGYYFKGVENVRMEDVACTSGYAVQGEPLHISNSASGSCKSISWKNCNFGHYGGSSTLPKDLMIVKGIDNPINNCELPLTADYVRRKTNTYSEKGKLVAEDLRLIRFAKTLVAPQTGQATIDLATKTITAISGFDFSLMDYDTLIYLNTTNNPHRFYTLTFNSTGSVLHIDNATIVDDVNVTVTIIHGMGLYHRGNIVDMSKTSISLYAENEADADRCMHLEFLNGKAANTDNTSMSVTHPSDFYVVNYTGNQVPPSNAFSVIGETQPIRVWNNRTVASNAKLIIEQLNF